LVDGVGGKRAGCRDGDEAMHRRREREADLPTGPSWTSASSQERHPVNAVALDSFDAQPGLRDDLPDPSPGPNHVVVRVRACFT
jgi:hypothetical protein